ncbi:hypothetical protein TESS_TESS_01416 [Tessaracoccus sp. O5.2]|uniref:hypothetical protein n=1 Tax=Tessaracoccus sp. O5.2 TaxID=3157622 RepID=UPI0035E89409
MTIMGIVIVQNVTMLEVWDSALAWLEATTGITNYALIFTVAFAAAVSLPVGLLALSSRLAAGRNLESTMKNFARFGHALIPLDVAGHIAHNLFHLLAEGGSVLTTVAALVGITYGDGSPALAGDTTIRILQFALLALGIAGSLYTARRITHRRYQSITRRTGTFVPMAVLIAFLGALNIYLFLLPMAHRM